MVPKLLKELGLAVVVPQLLVAGTGTGLFAVVYQPLDIPGLLTLVPQPLLERLSRAEGTKTSLSHYRASGGRPLS